MKTRALPLTEEMVDAMAQRFRLLGEPVRLRLLQLLEQGERNVNDITAALGGNQPNISRHLAALHEGGLVSRRRDGTSVFYSIADPVVFQLCELVCNSTRRQMRIKLDAFETRRNRKPSE